MRLFLSLLAPFLLLSSISFAQPVKVIDVWPSLPPDEKRKLGPEHDTTKANDNLIAGKPVIRLGNISKRHHAAEWRIDPNRIGILGFSAGGHLAAALASNYGRRTYSPIDAADTTSCRPNFALLIYPGGLVPGNSDQLSAEVQPSTNTPLTFIAMAADDPVRVENALAYGKALQKLRVPVELHVYASGAYGYGLRPRPDLPVTTWPQRASDWLLSQGLLK